MRRSCLSASSALLLFCCAGFVLPHPLQFAAAEPVSFELDVQPILAARGCSTGACHGKARGQNGFQLSLLCFDAEFDHAALTKKARGRLIFSSAPSQSLLLKKPTAQVPHGGGQRFTAESREYEILKDWIEAGSPRRLPGEPVLESVLVSPDKATLAPNASQELSVTANYSDGSTRDVTELSMFQSSQSAVVEVRDDGVLVAGPIPGEASIMARYMNLIATCYVAIPLPGEVSDSVYQRLPRNNFVDGLVWDKLRALRILPSPLADDETFLRRAHIDIIGRLPSPDEVRTFLNDASSDKRERLIDRLLQRPEFADHWANKWVDLLRPNPYRVGIKAVFNYDHWIRRSFRTNKPYDQFVRELITARGSTWHNGATTLFRDRRSPEELATLVSQLFLGTRLECAKCHHHPFEKWGQDDFYGFAAYFAKIGRKGRGLSPPISGSEEMILTSSKGGVRHPITGEEMPPRPLFGSAPELDADTDPREALARWITSDDNDLFVRVMANRVWTDLMGRGIVEPVDDLRATNPPSNEPLLDALARAFRRQRYDLKELVRTITTSYVYGLSSMPVKRNVSDTRNYSRHYRQRMRAEVLLGAINDVTGVGDSFSAMPSGSRANQLWTHRVRSLFLDTFGRPDPNQDPPCERLEESTVTQALHLMNSPALHEKVTSDSGRAARLAASNRLPDELLNELYLLIYARLPDDAERKYGRGLFAGTNANRREITEDLMWAMINSPEFLFED